MRRGSELNLPRLREAGVEFLHGDVREPADLVAAGALRRDGRVLRRALGPGRLRRRLLLGPDQPGRRLQLPRAGAPARTPSSSSSRPAASIRSRHSWSSSWRRPRPASSSLAEQPAAGRRAGGHRRGLPAARRPHALRRDQALRRAADRGVRRAPSACGRSSTAVASSPAPGRWGRSTRASSPGGCSATTSAGPLSLHRLRRLRQAGARPAPRRRPRRPGRRAARSSRSAGAGVTANVGGGRECSLSLLETTEICRELTGNEVPIVVEPETRARATCRSTSATARGCIL